MKEKEKAEEIFNYCCDILAEGVFIDEEIKKNAIKDIEFLIVKS